MRRILSWFSTTSNTSNTSNTSEQSLHSNLSESEKKERFHHVSSKESLCEGLIREIHDDMATLQKLYTMTKDKKEHKNLQNRMNQLTTDLYELAHKRTVFKLEREILQDLIDPENEF